MKIKEYIIKLKNNKKYYYATIIGLILLIGVTFAYVIDQISGGALSKVFITADTTDNLQFEVDKDIIIKPTQFNFGQGEDDLTDTATARLKANSTNNKAIYEYYVYFYIEKNEYIYTTTDHKPEMILQVTNPNGTIVTSINGLTYNNSLQGFDITEIDGVIPIAKGYEITSNSSSTFIEQNWIFTVKFINLDSNQSDNEGKTLEAKILIQRDVIKTFDIAGSNLATTAGALANFDCADATAVYSYKNNELQISNLNDYTKFKNCNLSFTARTEKHLLNEKIISLETETANRTDWKLVHETITDTSGNTVDTGYRYEGKEPENYIWFNNELWRIIGVFGEEMHGQAGEQLVKIIRNESIGLYRFGYSSTWMYSNVFHLLNPDENNDNKGTYYYKKDGTTSGYCTYGRQDKTVYTLMPKTNCDFRKIGISKDYRQMIRKSSWNNGTYVAWDAFPTVTEAFLGERSTTKREYYIGLMYPSDYGFSSICSRDTRLLDYYQRCASLSWLFSYKEYTNQTQNSYSTTIDDDGAARDLNGSTSRYHVRPVLYLDASVYVIEGTGTITNPYIIGM